MSDWRLSSQVSLARRIARFGIGGYDALYALPGTADLVGREVAEFSQPRRDAACGAGRTGGVCGSWRPRDIAPLHPRARLLAAPPTRLPSPSTGASSPRRGAIRRRGATVLATMIPEDALRPGRNEVAVFLIDRTGDTTTLESTLPLKQSPPADVAASPSSRRRRHKRRWSHRPARWLDAARATPGRARQLARLGQPGQAHQRVDGDEAHVARCAAQSPPRSAAVRSPRRTRRGGRSAVRRWSPQSRPAAGRGCASPALDAGPRRAPASTATR